MTTMSASRISNMASNVLFVFHGWYPKGFRIPLTFHVVTRSPMTAARVKIGHEDLASQNLTPFKFFHSRRRHVGCKIVRDVPNVIRADAT